MNDESIKRLDDLYSKHINNVCSTGFSNMDHYQADVIIMELLAEVGFEKVIDAFDDVEKEYA